MFKFNFEIIDIVLDPEREKWNFADTTLSWSLPPTIALYAPSKNSIRGSRDPSQFCVIDSQCYSRTVKSRTVNKVA